MGYRNTPAYWKSEEYRQVVLKRSEILLERERLKRYRVAERLPIKKAKMLARQKFYDAVHGTLRSRRSHRFFEYIGCSATFLRGHLESMFADGMSWDDKRSWRIDHIVPISWWDINDPEHRFFISHWTNLRPITAKENGRKADNYCHIDGIRILKKDKQKAVKLAMIKAKAEDPDLEQRLTRKEPCGKGGESRTARGGNSVPISAR